MQDNLNMQKSVQHLNVQISHGENVKISKIETKVTVISAGREDIKLDNEGTTIEK